MFSSFFLMRCRSRSSGPSTARGGPAWRRPTIRSRGTDPLRSLIRDPHRLPHPFHRLSGDGARAPGALVEYLFQAVRLRDDRGAPLANRFEVRVQRRGELGFHLDVTHLAGTVAFFQILDFRGVRIERVMVREDRIRFHRPRDAGADPLGVGVHPHDLLLDVLGHPTTRWLFPGPCSSSCRRQGRAGG